MSPYHGEGSGLVTVLGAIGLLELIRDASLTVASDGTTRSLVGGASVWSASSSSLGVGVSGVRAAKLVHEIRNNAVEVKTGIESLLGEINEVV